eukprot:6197239-Amphidinium_carterae.1
MQATQLHNSWLTEAIRASKASAHEFLQSIKQESAAESAKAQEQLAQAKSARESTWTSWFRMADGFFCSLLFSKVLQNKAL